MHNDDYASETYKYTSETGSGEICYTFVVGKK